MTGCSRQAAPVGPVFSRFHILCVCTGNICRSPAAERLLSAQLGPGVQVSSAGTHALIGQPMSPPMDQLVQNAGAKSEDFAARRLTERMLQPVDLVLALTRAHRGDVVALWPKAVRRAFTLKEFARLVQGIDRCALPSGGPVERLRPAVPLASVRRSQVLDPRMDDVVDPYGRPAEQYDATFFDIEQAVSSIIRVLGPQ